MIKKAIPFIAVIVAVAITTTMDFTGYTNFSALPLFGIIIIFYFLQKQSKKEFGLVFGKLKYYGLALLYPFLVLGTAVLAAYVYGDFSITEFDTKKIITNLSAQILIGPIMLLLTEEGFFRGWLWGAFKKNGLSPKQTLIVTSLLFVTWHISAVTSGSEYSLPPSQVPIYLINAMLLGLIWGTLRWASNSVIVAAVCHTVWNAFAYLLFGFGVKVGLLGIANTALFGPEVGYLGILLNTLFFLWLWKTTKQARLSNS